MKKLKFLGKALAALVLAGGMLFSATSCSGNAEDVVNAITGNPTVDNLLGQLTVGTYTGSLANVTATPGDKRVTFTWTNPTDENFCGVHIYKNTDTTPVADISADENSTTVSNLTNGETYTFTLFPKGKESDGSIKIGKNPSYKTVTLEKTPVDKDYVGKISNLTYSIGDGQVTFYWKNPADVNFTGVKIYVGEELYATTEAEETSCVVEALTNGETYSFSFKACGKNAEGAEVDSLNVVQKRVKLPFISDDDYIGEISKVEYEIGDNEVTFTWINPDDENFSGVAVYLGDVKKDDLEKEAKSYTFTNLEVGDYTFKLMPRGKNKKGVVVDSLNSFTKTIHVEKFSKYSFIGRGYNAITGEYFCYSNGLKDQIIEFNKDYRPTVEGVFTSDVNYSAGTTFSSYQKNFTQSAGIEGSFAGFSGSVDVDFSSSESFSEETSFASANGLNKKEREYLTSSQASLDNLKAHLTEDFRAAINNPNVTPAKIFKDYGTHVMLDTYVGGRFVVNYTYKNTERESAESITVAVKANYEGAFSVGTSSSTGFGSNSKMSTSNTNISGYSRGGKSISFGDMESAVAEWKEWSESLDNDSSTWSLIDSPDTINNQYENTGIWLFADDSARQNAIKDAYLVLIEQNADSFAAKQTSKWVKHITFYSTGTNAPSSMADLRNKVRAAIGHDNFIIAGENAAVNYGMSAWDLLNGCGSGGHYVYLVMEMTTKKEEALRGVIGNSAKSATDTENVTYRNKLIDKNQWTEITGLNPREGNYRNGTPKRNGYQNNGYRVLFESKTQNRDGTVGEKAYPIKEVAIFNRDDSTTSASAASKNWKLGLGPNSNGVLDINSNDISKDTGGDDIFLRLYYDPLDIPED